MAYADQSLSPWRGIIIGVICIFWLVFVIGGFFAIGFADANPNVGEAGFFAGVWQGAAAPLSFIGQLLGFDVNIYEVNNNGGWYNFGYLIGISVVINSSRTNRN